MAQRTTNTCFVSINTIQLSNDRLFSSIVHGVVCDFTLNSDIIEPHMKPMQCNATNETFSFKNRSQTVRLESANILPISLNKL